MIILIRTICLLFLFTTTSLFAAPYDLPPAKKISEHVYAWIGPLEGPDFKNKGFRMNMAYVVGKSGIAVIDTGYTPMMAAAMLKQIKAMSSLPVKYAINTSSQPHRFMGNDIFRQAGAQIIAHADSVKRMNKNGSNYVSTIERILKLKAGTISQPKSPGMVLSTDTTLDLGGIKLNVLSLGATHTPAQLVVEVVEDKVICAGDVLYGERLLAILPDSNVSNWIRAFDRLRHFKAYTFIPGHGQPGGLDTFEFSTYSYLTRIRQHMSKAVEEFVDLQDAINSFDQRDFSQLENFSTLAGRNASWTYLLLEAGEK